MIGGMAQFEKDEIERQSMLRHQQMMGRWHKIAVPLPNDIRAGLCSEGDPLMPPPSHQELEFNYDTMRYSDGRDLREIKDLREQLRMSNENSGIEKQDKLKYIISYFYKR